MKLSGVADLYNFVPVQVQITVPGDLSAEQWAAACAARLIELRPAGEQQALWDAARSMAESLAYFDPVMAAEMEHEGGMLDG